MASRGWTLGFWALVLVLPGGLLLLPFWLFHRRRQQAMVPRHLHGLATLEVASAAPPTSVSDVA